jgi:hypothetical protein
MVAQNTQQDTSSSTNQVLDGLNALSQKIADTVEQGKREGVLRPTEEIYTHYPIDRHLS